MTNGKRGGRRLARLRAGARERWQRLVYVAPTIVQTAVAAGLAWVVAREVVGHPRPFFAPIAAVICVGVATGRRLRRLAELMAGVTVGVGVGDLLISMIGSGAWQIALVVALAMGTAALLDGAPLISLQAGSSAVLVATLLPPSGTGGLDRMVDTLVGGVLGIAMVALLPTSPAALAHRHASAVLEALADALERTADAIEDGDPELAELALREVRKTQGVIDEFEEAVRTGREIATISPLRWRRRAQLLRYDATRVPLDHALRNTRVLARRTTAALKGGSDVPGPLVDALHALARASLLLRDELATGRDPETARQAVLNVIPRLREIPTGPTSFSVNVMTALLRSLIVDLLTATGADRETAAESLPPLAP
ncbi:uncharacterized membrane protein YgaE (UPF0421/DUF939 family) [Thermocatellispora tengchongensis]|uniref:Uncharacterized membrane protein YgaE (UPF0421/DUF939 family) n=2 Tax=Thermocatellispora tengchongensis TaxID=1073253 RepID=A0A840PWY1_9ACTN|nr:FUSC family protein [Thermocatellispora tengchongensis]MBB5140375.1 uncharacterized membrane protein YgaE (UPF0421/DUF939 family) [Thermocatellispora tengchongensis]